MLVFMIDRLVGYVLPEHENMKVQIQGPVYGFV